MIRPGQLWDLDLFPERLQVWRELEHPSPGVLAVVEEWIPTRKIDPLQGARLERQADNFWVARIPHTLHDGHIVICSYWIDRAAGLVKCDLFGTLALPV